MKAYGDLVECLTDIPALSPRVDAGHRRLRVAIHAFAGSAEVARRLLSLRNVEVYFGINAACLDGLSSKRRLSALTALPLDRVLLESDAHTFFDSNLRIRRAQDILSKQYGIPPPEVLSKTTLNAVKWLFGSHTPCCRASAAAGATTAEVAAPQLPENSR